MTLSTGRIWMELMLSTGGVPLVHCMNHPNPPAGPVILVLALKGMPSRGPWWPTCVTLPMMGHGMAVLPLLQYASPTAPTP